MSTSSPINPYETPRESSRTPDFSDRDSVEVADLRKRVSELERQVAGSWMVRGNVFHRTVAVWAYLLLGYIVVAAFTFGAVSLIRWATGDF